jgi:hypothetical protein
MAALIGHSPSAIVGAPGEVHTVAKNPVLTRAFDVNGNEFIYLKGVANTDAYEAVVYDEAGATILTVTTSVGPVAISTAATVASTWGWYQIFGLATVKVAAGGGDNAVCHATATDGTLEDSGAGAETFIFGAITRSAIDTPATGLSYVQLTYPWKSSANLD